MIKNMDEILSAAKKASKEQLHGYTYKQKEVDLVGKENLEAKKVDWNTKGSPGYVRKNILDWNKPDMLAYCFAQHRYFTGQCWSISYGGAQEGLKLMQEGLKQVFGEWPSNKLTKYYIDWFFKEQAEYLIGIYGFISFKMMRHEKSIRDFVGFCQEQNVELKTKDKTEAFSSEEVFTEVDINEVMHQGVNAFISRYGILVCYYWLRNKENYNKKVSINKICQSILDSISQKSVNELFALTEKFGPYPSAMKTEFTELLERLAHLTGKPFTLISVEYTDEPKKQLFPSS